MLKTCIAAALTALACCVQAQNARPFTATDLVSMERVSGPQLSPDGRWAVYSVRETALEENRGQSRLWLLDAKNGGSRPLTRFETGASSPQWAPDGQSIYFLSSESGNSQVWELDLRGGEPQRVTDLPLDVEMFRVSPNGKQLALSMSVYLDCTALDCSVKRLKERADDWQDGVLYEQMFVRHWDHWKDGRHSQLFITDLQDHGLSNIAKHLSAGVHGDIPSKPFGGDEELRFSPDGKQLYFGARLASRSESWSTNFDIYVVPTDGSTPARNLTVENLAMDTQPRPSPDGKQLAWLAHSRPGLEADRFRIMLADADGANAREVAPDWDRSPGALAWGAKGKTLFVTAQHLGQHPLFAVDVRKGTVKQLTGDGDVGGYSVHADRIVYAEDALDRPAELFSISPRGGKAYPRSGHTLERTAKIAFGDYEQFQFSGANGETVHGYVMKPANYVEGRKYPVAFLIHGGPQGSFGNHFHYRWNPQFYAGAGYASVFIDFHGSTGYGQAFTDSISGDWGGKPLEDLQKGWATALQRYEFLDGERACALGASYGGYMINWIASQWPNAFDCLVNHDGIFDTQSFYYSTEELWFPEAEFGGPYFKNPQGYEQFNPANHVGKWKTPMLVIQGSHDYRVPLEQGLATFTALQRRGLPSQLLHFPDENHFVLKPHNSLQWHQTVKDWLDRWTRE